jgi:hypothetical protein
MSRLVALLLGLSFVALSTSVLLYAWLHHGDLSTSILGVVTLGVALVTLYYVIPRPAVLVIESATELGYPDVAFLSGTEEVEGVQVLVPRSLVVGVHLAVANAGGRKAVLSRLVLTEFQDAAGSRIDLPLAAANKLPLKGLRSERELGVPADGAGGYQTRIWAPPYVLDPDDVVHITVNALGALDWSSDLASLARDVRPLERAIDRAVIVATYRKGTKLSSANLSVTLSVDGQHEWVAQVAHLTNGFTTLPQPLPQTRDPYDLLRQLSLQQVNEPY